MKNQLIYEIPGRNAYSLEELENRTMTAGQLIEFLQNYDPDTKIFLSFDSGWTYGAVQECRFSLGDEEEY